MDLQKLFELQSRIESDIAQTTTIPEDVMGSNNVEELRFLALHIKLAELANLTKCYKYYYVKPNIPKDKLTLRFVDAFQYLLSIGNRTEYNIITLDALPKINEKNIIKLFSMVIDQVSQVKKYYFNNNFIQGIHEYTLLFAIILNLAKVLEIEFEEVVEYLEQSRVPFQNLRFEDINL